MIMTTENKSKCCNSSVTIISCGDGPNFYVCDKCKEPTDAIEYKTELDALRAELAEHERGDAMLLEMLGSETIAGGIEKLREHIDALTAANQELSAKLERFVTADAELVRRMGSETLSGGISNLLVTNQQLTAQLEGWKDGFENKEEDIQSAMLKVAELTAQIDEARKVITELRDACKQEPAINNNKYVQLGIRVNQLLSTLERKEDKPNE